MKVNFFPRKDLEATVCDYRHGKRFAIHQNTDTAIKKFTYFQMYQAFLFNLKSTIFSNQYKNGGANSIDDIEHTDIAELGVFEFQAYFPTDRWVNPITGADEIIPDYYSDTWTSAGEAVFNVTAGTPKPTGNNGAGVAIIPTRYPNHGQDMYDASAGALGYSDVSGEVGESGLSELVLLYNRLQKWFLGNVSKRTSVFSYRNGRNISPNVYKPIYLAGRNSDRDVTRNYFGVSKVDNADLGNPIPLTRLNIINQPIVTRWVDSFISTTPGAPEAANQSVRDNITEAYADRGMYTDFSHWHSAVTNDVLENLYDVIADHLDSTGYRDDVWVAGYGELWEYFWFRQLVRRAVATEVGGKIAVTLEWNDWTTVTDGLPDNIPTGLINTPLSIEVNLSGTPLAGKNIKSSGGRILSKGDDVYIIDFPFHIATSEIKVVVLSEGDGIYYDSDPLTGAHSISGGTITVLSNHNTKAVLLRHLAEETVYEIEPAEYVNTYQDEHKFVGIDIETYDYYVGLIDNFDQRILIPVQFHNLFKPETIVNNSLVSSTGNVISNSNYARTSVIYLVHGMKRIYYHSQVPNNYTFCAFFDIEGLFISSVTVTSSVADGSFDIPAGAGSLIANVSGNQETREADKNEFTLSYSPISEYN